MIVDFEKIEISYFIVIILLSGKKIKLSYAAVLFVPEFMTGRRFG